MYHLSQRDPASSAYWLWKGMTADERLARIRVKVERARQLLAELDAALKVFKEAAPYTVGTRRDPETQKLIYYLSSMLDAPVAIPAVTGEIIHSLRSALDHLAYQLFLVGPGGRAGKSGHHIYFPIFDSAAEYKARVGLRTDGIGADAMRAFSGVEPYQNGKGHWLWRLAKLNNTDKHRLLITVGCHFQSIDIGPSFAHKFRTGPDEPGFEFLRKFRDFNFLLPTSNKALMKVGDELFSDLTGGNVDDKLQFRFNVAINEPEIAECEPVLAFLGRMIESVDDLLTGFRPFLARDRHAKSGPS